MPSASSFFWIWSSMIWASCAASTLVPVAGTVIGAVILLGAVFVARSASFFLAAFLPPWAWPSAGLICASEAVRRNAAAAVTIQVGPERTHLQRRVGVLVAIISSPPCSCVALLKGPLPRRGHAVSPMGCLTPPIQAGSALQGVS